MVLTLGGGAVGFTLASVVPALVVIVGSWIWFRIRLDWSSTNKQSFIMFATMGLPFLAWGTLARFRQRGRDAVFGLDVERGDGRLVERGDASQSLDPAVRADADRDTAGVTASSARSWAISRRSRRRSAGASS